MARLGHTLASIVDQAARLTQVYKASLRCGDTMIVKTWNSQYTLRVLDYGTFAVTGGWFDRQGKSPMTVRVTGCTWGGSAIKINIAAGSGLCLEFGNRVRTSPIRYFIILPNGHLN